MGSLTEQYAFGEEKNSIENFAVIHLACFLYEFRP